MKNMLIKLMRRNFTLQLPQFIDQTLLFTQENQLVGFKQNGGIGGDFFRDQVKYFTCVGITGWTQQDNIMIFKMTLNGIGVYGTQFTGQLEINPITNAIGFCGDKIT